MVQRSTVKISRATSCRTHVTENSPRLVEACTIWWDKSSRMLRAFADVLSITRHNTVTAASRQVFRNGNLVLSIEAENDDSAGHSNPSHADASYVSRRSRSLCPPK